MRVKLLFSDENGTLIEKLQQAFEGNPDLIALTLQPDELPKLKELDALYLSIIAAQQWGSNRSYMSRRFSRLDPNHRFTSLRRQFSMRIRGSVLHENFPCAQ